MFYEFRITTPANTPASAPLQTELQLDAGAITAVEVLFPSGCIGLVHLTISDELHQVWPVNADADISGDTFPIGWRDDFELTDTPYTLRADVWNLDDSYEHTVTIRFEFVPLATWRRRQRAGDALDYLARWFGTGPAAAATEG